MKVYPPRDIRPFVMYCVNGKPRSSLLIESTDSMILFNSYVYYYTLIVLIINIIIEQFIIIVIIIIIIIIAIKS